MTVTVHHGDCREVLATLAEASVDSVVCDPPYHLTSIVKRLGASDAAPIKDRDGAYKRQTRGFMGKTWDGGDVAFQPATWEAVYRVLKPGAHLVAFGGTRTYHRMACAIEDAGFDVRDTLAWLYGSGFPKSHNVGKAIDKANGDAREVVGHKLTGTMAGQSGSANAANGWRGGQEIVPITAPASAASAAWEGWGTALKPAFEPILLARKPFKGTVAANVLQHGTGGLNIDGCRIGTTVETWPASRSYAPGQIQPGGKGKTQGTGAAPPGRWPANLCHDGSEEVLRAFAAFGQGGSGGGGQKISGGGGLGFFNSGKQKQNVGVRDFGDEGSAARFFYSAKADASDRLGSKHPTVKPVDLMRYLVRLVTPPGGLVLDPFAGTGTTGMAALMEGMRAVLIEREAEYVADINRRLAHMRGADAPLFTEVA